MGSKKANDLGLFDMSGNVLEWCWNRDGKYSTEPRYDSYGPSSGLNRVSRGGSVNEDGYRDCRVVARYESDPNYGDDFTGFRVVRSAPRY